MVYPFKITFTYVPDDQWEGAAEFSGRTGFATVARAKSGADAVRILLQSRLSDNRGQYITGIVSTEPVSPYALASV